MGGIGRSSAAPDAEFDAAFRDLFPKARGVAARIVHDRATAEDVAADALSRAYVRWEQVRLLPHRDAWVLRVAHNLAVNVVRRRPVVIRGPDATALEDEVARHLALAAALATLPHRQRQVVVLRHFAGMSELEIGRWLGVTHGTVKTHLRRGQSALRSHFDADLQPTAAVAG